MTTLLPLNQDTFNAAILAHHLNYARYHSNDFLDTLDNEFDGDIANFADADIREASDSNDYDDLLELFYAPDYILTDDDWDLLGTWLRDDTLLNMLTDAYKRWEPSARVVAANPASRIQVHCHYANEDLKTGDCLKLHGHDGQHLDETGYFYS